MSSKPVLPGYHSILARIRMQAPRKKVYVLVEGVPDQQFWAWNRFTKGEVQVQIAPMKGKDNIIGNEQKGILGLPELFGEYDSKEGGSEEIRKRVIGIHDDDYDQLLEPESKSDPNLFSTKAENDLEALLFSLWIEIGAPKFPAGRGMMEKKRLGAAIGISASIGILRAANRKNRWGLRFKSDGNRIQPWLREIVRRHDDENWFQNVMIRQLIEVQPNFKKRGIEFNTIVEGCREIENLCKESGLNRFALVNGHDLCKIVELISGGEIQHRELEKELRLNHIWSKIDKKVRKNFELFGRLDEWTKDSGSKLFKWQ